MIVEELCLPMPEKQRRTYFVKLLKASHYLTTGTSFTVSQSHCELVTSPCKEFHFTAGKLKCWHIYSREQRTVQRFLG